MLGKQFTDVNLHQTSTTYYSGGSGVGRTFEHYQLETARTGELLRVGAVGLGVGTLAAYVYQPWHTIRFYEINPDVVRLAEKHFTFLADARERASTVEIVLGDARLTLERELNDPQKFQMLVLDAFSGDSIPIHLLTTEAFDVYLQRLAPGGAIAVHISNRHLDLNRVVRGLAEHFELRGGSEVHLSIDGRHGEVLWPIGSSCRRTRSCSMNSARSRAIGPVRRPSLPFLCGPIGGTICWRFCIDAILRRVWRCPQLDIATASGAARWMLDRFASRRHLLSSLHSHGIDSLVTIGRALRQHDLSQCLSTVSGAAADQPVYSSVVRRQSGRLDDLPVVLSNGLVRRLCLCPFQRALFSASRADDRPFDADLRGTADAAHHPVRLVETGG